MPSSTPPLGRRKPGRKAFWLKQFHTWHWVSSAISLIGMVLFTITGITLNHAAEIEGAPVIAERSAALPAHLRAQIAPDDKPDTKKPLPPGITRWAQETLALKAGGDADWSADEVYLALPRPGGDGWMAIDRISGDVTTESTDRGWISYLNDLHKGRNAGGAWKWFIDIFAVACLIFALTGLLLLQLHSKKRPSTWPIVGFGLVIPAAIAIFFIH